MEIHELKTDPQVFEESWSGKKLYEIRLDDRSFEVGDILVLRETESDGEWMEQTKSKPVYTGRVLSRQIISKTTRYGMQAGWCVLGVRPI